MPGEQAFRWRTVGSAEEGRLFAAAERERGTGAYAGLEFLLVRARSLINRIPPGPLPFQYTINAYRGCSHACTYCFARPTHAYLGLDTSEGFDRQIVVKVNAPELARAELNRSRWAGHPVAMGTNTDPYQQAEAKFRLTRGVLEALTEAGNPFSILTKSGLVLRDLDLLTVASSRARVRVDLSIATLDPVIWRATEPGTPHPALRLRALAKLRAAGIDAGVLVAPLLPGISDAPHQISAVVAGAVAAGATALGTSVLHLRPGVREHFLATLGDTHPDLVEGVRRLYGNGRAGPPREVQQRIERQFSQIVADHGGPDHQRWRSTEPAPPDGRSLPPRERSVQLALPLRV